MKRNEENTNLKITGMPGYVVLHSRRQIITMTEGQARQVALDIADEIEKRQRHRERKKQGDKEQNNGDSTHRQ